MCRCDAEAEFRDLLNDPLIQALIIADKVDASQLEAMLIRIADDMKLKTIVDIMASDPLPKIRR